MRRSSLRSLVSGAFVSTAIVLTACGNGHLTAGKAYQSSGQLALAMAYFDEGLGEDDDTELRDALIEAHALRKFQLRREIDKLTESKRHLAVVSRLVELSEISRRGSARSIPADDVAGIESELASTTKLAISSVAADLDQRQGRGEASKSDLAVCRQLSALDGSDADTAARCERLRSGFKLYASFRWPSDASSALIAQITKAIGGKNLELLQVVPVPDERRNAEIEVAVGAHEVVDTSWVMMKRDAYRTWVHRLDKKGRPVTETITVAPTKAAIDAAAKAKQPAPEPTVVVKQVWDEVAGEYRFFERRLTVTVPYSLVVRDLRGHRVVGSWSGTIAPSVVSRYHEYSGHPRARRSQLGNVGPPGRGAAAGLPDPDALVAGELPGLGQQLTAKVAERIE